MCACGEKVRPPAARIHPLRIGHERAGVPTSSCCPACSSMMQTPSKGSRVHSERLLAVRTSLRCIFIAATLLICPLASCTPSATSEWAGTINEINGVFHVSNPATAAWGASERRLSLELEQVFGADRSPAQALLGEPYDLSVAVGMDGSVYVLDGQASRLISFAPDGSVRWRAGRAGKGPGEFEYPEGLVLTPDDFIVLMNQSRSQLDIWDSAGRFVSTTRLSELSLNAPNSTRPTIVGFLEPGIVVLAGGIRGGAGSYITVVDLTKLTVRHQFAWTQLPSGSMPLNLSLETSVRADEGVILTGSSVGYEFGIYAEDGSILRRVTRAVDYPVRGGVVQDDASVGLRAFGRILAPMYVDPSYMLVCATWTQGVADPDALAREFFLARKEGRPTPTTDERSSFDLYDREGRLLASVEDRGGQWVETGVPQFIGPDNRLYTIAEDPFPQIRRYKVVIH